MLLPFSIGVGLLASSIVGSILSLIVSEASLEKYTHALNPIIISFFSIVLCQIIAPRYKSKAVISICCLWLLVILFCLFVIAFGDELYGEEYEIKDGGLAIIMTICGLALGYYLIWRRGAFKFGMLEANGVNNEKSSRILRKIDEIKGLGGMTVNERLYVSGLMDEFDTVLLSDKTRAKEILTWLKVDEKSIEQILNYPPTLP